MSTAQSHGGAPHPDPLKVLCITGWCRNGSTILGNVLGEIPGFFHVGELHFLWKNMVGKGANSRCGCGLALRECAGWSGVFALDQPAGTDPVAYAETVLARQRRYVRTRHTWRVLRRGVHDDGIRAHADLMTHTYQAIAAQSGARVLVDTTKIPGEAALLGHLAGIEPYYVHLVRDPRAVAQSWSHEKDYCYALPARTSTGYWYGFNLAARAVTRRYPNRSVFLRYEDFIADPAGTIDALLRLVGEQNAGNPVQGHTVDLHTNHTVTGNPDRFRTGRTVIRDRDDTWRTELPIPARLTAAALAGPLLWRYGYRYRGTLTGRPRAGAVKEGARGSGT